VFKSAKRAGLHLERGVFTRGRNPYKYLDALKANLFLSANEADVMSALDANCPAARVYPESRLAASRHADELRIAFDGDAVLFSDEAEKVYQQDGLQAFTEHEAVNVLQPLPPGPFKPLLEALHRLQAAARDDVGLKIRTALVTARSAPTHERAVRTLMNWNIDVDEAMFLGGMDKGAFLKAFEPDFYFDDQHGHIESARIHVAAGHVPFGVANLR
jgi:5'-nucleotidase